MKYAVLLVLALLVLVSFNIGQLQARGYALLQYTSSSSGYHYSNAITDVFSYSDSLNGMLLPSGFARNLHVVDDGEITDYNTNYSVNHTVNSFPDGTQIDYDCCDSVGAPFYHQTLFFDNNDRLIYRSNDHDNIRQFRRFINPVTNLNDSLIMKLNQTSPNFFKFTYSYDNLNRVSIRNMYLSADSLSWSLYQYSTFEYGSPSPINLSIYQPETLSYNLLNCFVDEQYCITSQTIHRISDGYTYTLVYSFSTSNPFHYSYNIGEAYYSFFFNNFGRLIEFNDFYSPSFLSFTYTWGEYTSVEDDIIIPGVMKVYPNPFAELLNIKLNSELKTPVDISIYNIRGQSVRSYKNAAGSKLVWDGKDINQNPVRSGLYIIRVTQDKQITTLKAVKLQN